MNRPIFSFLFLLSSCFACQTDYLYEEETVLKEAIWTYDQPVRYEFYIQNTTTSYNLYLDIQHSTQFPFQNLYTKIKTTYPDGRTVDSPISMDLANKLGEWYGKCNQEACRLRVNLQQNTFFKEAGKHQIIFEQYTRKEALNGVQSLGFIVEEVGN